NLQTRLETLTRQNAELESKLFNLQGECDQLTRALNQTNTRVNELKDQLDRERSDQARLKEQLADVHRRMEQAHKGASATDQEKRLLQ
ncbi:hypothetical protein CRM22_000648, partial [Opisthorchis felineus]